MESHRDFSDLLREFSSARVEFFVAGAHALGVHDRTRTTKAQMTTSCFRSAWHPVRTDIFTSITGVDFDAASPNRVDAARVRRRLGFP